MLAQQAKALEESADEMEELIGGELGVAWLYMAQMEMYHAFTAWRQYVEGQKAGRHGFVLWSDRHQEQL